MTLEKDIKNINAGGIELPNLCDPVDFKKFIEWDGSALSIQHIKLSFISKSFLEKLKSKPENSKETVEDKMED